MSPADRTSTDKPGTEELEARVVRQRQALAETADALGAKLDVKARATEKAAEVKESVTSTVTTETGRPRPTLLAGATALAAAIAALVWWRRRS